MKVSPQKYSFNVFVPNNLNNQLQQRKICCRRIREQIKHFYLHAIRERRRIKFENRCLHSYPFDHKAGNGFVFGTGHIAKLCIAGPNFNGIFIVTVMGLAVELERHTGFEKCFCIRTIVMLKACNKCDGKPDFLPYKFLFSG